MPTSESTATTRVVSRNGVMFFADPVAAFTNLARALKPEGRVVLAAWIGGQRVVLRDPQRGRCWSTHPAPRGGGSWPFSLSDPARVHAILTSAGFDEPEFVGVHEPMIYRRDVTAAEAMALGMVGGALVDLDDAARDDALAALRAALASHLGHDGVTYRSAMWIITTERAR